MLGDSVGRWESPDEPTGRGENRLKAGIILVGNFVHRPEEVVETEIIAARGAQHDRQSFAARVSDRVVCGVDRFLPPSARPVEDGDAFRPRTVSDIARP
jgi:hypothetical protein